MLKMSYLHSNIKHLRELNGLNQTQLGEIVGKKKAVISVYEQGTSEPPLITLFALSDYFGFSVDSLIKLDLSNNESQNLLDIKSPKILDKSNKTENGDDNKNDNRHDNNGYILEDNQGVYRVEEEAVQSHKIIKQSDNIAQNQGLSPPEVEILKERIQSLREILKSKEEVLKAKDRHIELLEDKIKNLQNQVNNPLRKGEHNIRDAA